MNEMPRRRLSDRLTDPGPPECERHTGRANHTHCVWCVLEMDRVEIDHLRQTLTQKQQYIQTLTSERDHYRRLYQREWDANVAAGIAPKAGT